MNLFRWLVQLISPSEPMVNGVNGVPVEKTEAGRLYLAMQRACPDCGSTDGYLEGPSGGMSTNIFCANRECRAGFNVTPVIGIAERIQQGDIRHYPEAK